MALAGAPGARFGGQLQRMVETALITYSAWHVRRRGLFSRRVGCCCGLVPSPATH